MRRSLDTGTVANSCCWERPLCVSFVKARDYQSARASCFTVPHIGLTLGSLLHGYTVIAWLVKEDKLHRALGPNQFNTMSQRLGTDTTGTVYETSSVWAPAVGSSLRSGTVTACSFLAWSRACPCSRESNTQFERRPVRLANRVADACRCI